eukprot:TRINITY_DN108324_c0_g1_i2.p1 TRINITY_DN108324_c0_g1~~TRINITY_DN108324_c0_g1_i2.p1  ORF type:complete len:180 (+),score=34.63 TRINITY_DN108324_c0_g1_i2:59-598(+)
MSRAKPPRVLRVLVLALCAYLAGWETLRAFVVAPAPCRATRSILPRSAAAEVSTKQADDEQATAKGGLDPGDIVRLTGIPNRDDLNGVSCLIDRWNEEKQAWVVKELTVFASNLELKTKNPDLANKDRELDPAVVVIAVFFTGLFACLWLVVLVPLVLQVYKDATGQDLLSLPDSSIAS